MSFKIYRDEEGEGTVLEKPDGTLVKLPQGSDEGTYEVSADIVQELAAQRCDAAEIKEEAEEAE